MIALIRGQIAYKSLDHLIVDVGGVGYRLFIPLSTYYALPEEGEVSLYTHTHVREDALLLYGFISRDELELFTILIGITGIGPKLAVNLLSHIPVNDLKLAISCGDVKRLSSLPGTGKTTAERLVLELKDKVSPAPGQRLSATTVPAKAVTDPLQDVLSALVNLGYKENLARKVLEEMEVGSQATTEDILKAALKILVR